jgi:Ni,Fe-hydrogenase I cytochrome b subunit
MALYYRHRLPVRIMHWINVIAFVVMLMSGLMIFNAHPTLNWGKQSYGDAPEVLSVEAYRDRKAACMAARRFSAFVRHYRALRP